MKPGNAGGGKYADFWCAFEAGEVKVIGDVPGNTDSDPEPTKKAHAVNRPEPSRDCSAVGGATNCRKEQGTKRLTARCPNR